MQMHSLTIFLVVCLPSLLHFLFLRLCETIGMMWTALSSSWLKRRLSDKVKWTFNRSVRATLFFLSCPFLLLVALEHYFLCVEGCLVWFSSSDGLLFACRPCFSLPVCLLIIIITIPVLPQFSLLTLTLLLPLLFAYFRSKLGSSSSGQSSSE